MSNKGRIKELQGLELLRTLPEKEYDNITQLAAFICNVPISLVSIVGEDRQYYKSHHGIELDETPLEHSFCKHAILEKDIFIVKDARKDKRFENNPYVTNTPNIVFYAGVPLITENGNPIGTLCIIDDKEKKISANEIDALKALANQVLHLFELRQKRLQLKRNKKVLEKKSEKLSNIISATRVGTWEWNIESNEVKINKRYASILGYKIEELSPHTSDDWYRLTHPDDILISDNQVQACFDQKADYYDIEYRMFHKKGHVVWIHDRGQVVSRDKNGKPLIMTGTHTDITERKNREVQFNAIANNIPGVVFRYILKPNGKDKLQSVSQGAKKLWGFSAKEAVENNQLIWSRYEKSDLPKHKKSIYESAENLSFWEDEWRYHHPDGTIRWHKGSGNPTKNEDGSVFWDSIILDISEQKLSEEELSNTLIRLKERVKEQSCLTQITSLSNDYSLKTNRLLEEAVKIIPSGWSDPKAVSASIVFNNQKFNTANHKSSAITQTVIKTTEEGIDLKITIAYQGKVPKNTSSPFLKEEEVLLEQIAETLVLQINHVEATTKNELILNSTEEGIYGIDKEGFCTFINPSAAKILGYRINECLGMQIHELIHYKTEKGKPVEKSDCPIHLAMVKAKGCKVEKDIFWNKKNKAIPVRYSSTPVFKNNEINGAVIVFSDITETIKKQELIRQKHEELKHIMKASLDVICTMNEKGNFVRVSYASKKIWGYEPQELEGKPFIDFVIDEDKKRTLEVTNQILQGKEVTNFENNYLSKSGKVVPVIWSAYWDKDTQLIYSSARDAREKKQAEEQLKFSERRFKGLVENSGDAFAIISPEGKTTYVSSSISNVLGYSEKEALEVKLSELMHPEDLPIVSETINQAMKEPGVPQPPSIARAKHKDGHWIYAEAVITNMLHEPAINGIVDNFRDVTEKVNQENEKKHIAELGRFFSEEDQLVDAIKKTLKYLTTESNYDLAEIWFPNLKGDKISLNVQYAASESAKLFFKDSKNIISFQLKEGLPGSTWNSGKLQIWEDISKNKRFIRNNSAKKSKLNSAIGIPLFHNKKVVGVIVLCRHLKLEKGSHIPSLFKALETFLGSEINRKQQEEEMLLLFKSAPDVIAISSPDGYFVKVNPAFCNILGYSEKELTTVPFKQLIHPEDLKPTLLEFEETKNGLRQSNNFANRYRTKDGSYKWISWSSSDVFGDEGLFFAYGRDISKIKKLEKGLENATKLANFGSWEIDFLKNQVFWSPMSKSIHEVPHDFQPDYELAFNFFRKDVRDQVAQIISSAIKKRSSFDFELPIITANNNERWVRVLGDPEYDKDKCIRIYGSIQDIHQQKTAEIELTNAFKERNNILESIGDAFFAIDNNWTVTYWNKMAEKILGRKRSEILNNNLWDCFPEAVELNSYQMYHKAMNTGKTVHFEDYYPINNQWLEVSAYPSSNGLSVYFKDVSIRKIAEENIRQSNERFKILAEATNDAIWDYDLVKDKLFWGEGFSTLFGHNLKKITPTFNFLLSCIHPDDREEIAKKMKDFIDNPTARNWFSEYRFQKSDGSFALVIDRAIFMRDKKGKAIRALGAMTDISYRREYEDSLKRLNQNLEKRAKELSISNAELEQFAYVASHDLQEPLRMVSGFLSQLKKKYSDQLDEKANKYIHFAVDGSQRMRQIILDLLEFSRVGKHDDQLQKVDLNQVIENTKSLLRRKIEQKNAQINYSNLPTIKSYPTPIMQIVQNLISNSIKYSQENVPPKITIKAKENKNEWIFSIKDNGIGISKEYFEKIFMIFQRLHAKGEYSGSGLGLAIVKKNIEHLDGKIWLKSEAGKGSTFYFSLPKN